MPARCFIPPENWPDHPEIRLGGREAHHLIRVLRVRKGEFVTCFDGRGREADCSVREIAAGQLLLEAGPARHDPDPRWSVTLGAAVPGQGKLEEIVSFATQLNVARIIPLQTERTVVRLTPDRFSRKLAHLRQVSVEAAKQCGISRLPEIRTLTPWREALAGFKEYDRVLLSAVEGPHEKWSEAGGGRNILLLIGPEGDFTSEEIRQAKQAGARPVSLGSSVLRCETAAVASLSILSFVLREKIFPWRP